MASTTLPEESTESESQVAVALPAAEAKPVPGADNPCPKCSGPIDLKKTSWCRQCGFYPQLNRFVELDPVETEQQAATTKTSGNFLKHIPGWAWLLGAGVLGLLGLSIVARLFVPEEGGLRMAWSFGQLGIGFLALVFAHIACYMFAIMETDRLNVLDIILKPLAIWITSAKELPRSFRRVAAGLWGFSAAFFAVVVVGAIPWSSLLDWGGEEKAKGNLIHAITKHAGGKGDGGMGMEEAINSFAGKAGADDLKGKEKKPEITQRRMKAECLIFGYVPNGSDDFSGLMLATLVNNRLTFVGMVTEGIPDEARALLNVRMRELERGQPFVQCPLEAVWLEPMLVCRVKFKDWTGKGRINKPMFDQLLAEVKRE